MSRLAALALWLGAAVSLGAQQDPWLDWKKAAAAAYGQKDYAGFRDCLRKMAAVTPAHPQVVYKLAAAEALAGSPEQALAGLRHYAALGLVRSVEADPDFASLRGRPELAEILRRIEENKKPVSHSEVAFTLPAGLLTEDIAYDSVSRCFYVSSIHKREILRINPGGAVSDFIGEGRDGVWGIMALAVDSDRRVLWASTSALPQSAGYRSVDEGRSAVLRYDLASGKLQKRYDPAPGERHSFGDMSVDAAGNVVVSDSFGPVYTIRRDRDVLEALVPAGVFTSAQTPATAPDGRVFVSDYGRGIGIVDPATHAVSWLAAPEDLALTGIDGLYRAGQTMIAVQNGTDPQRVIRLHLDPALRRVIRWEIIERNTPPLDEPTHGVFVGKDFYYIGHSGWDEWTDEGPRKPEATAKPSLILRTTGRP